MNTLFDFKRECAERNACARFKRQWDAAKDEKSLIDLACSAQGSDWVCAGTAFGWGMSPQYIASHFQDYLGEGHLSQQDGYTCRLFAASDNLDYSADATNITLIGCSGTVIIPKEVVCQLNIAGACNLNVFNHGEARFYIYGSEPHINLIYKDNPYSTTQYLNETGWKSSMRNSGQTRR